MVNTVSELLGQLGMSDYEVRSYLCLLQQGEGSVSDIAHRTGIKRTSVYNFIDHLVSAGLVIKKANSSPQTFTAVDPRKLVEMQRKRLDLLEEKIETIIISSQENRETKVSYFEGAEQVKQIMSEIFSCKNEACFIWPANHAIPMIGGSAFAQQINEMRLASGITIRSIRFRESDLEYPGSDQYRVSNPDQLQEVRYAPDKQGFEAAICLYDNGKVGFITPQQEGMGVLIESPAVHGTMQAMFEMFWECLSDKKK